MFFLNALIIACLIGALQGLWFPGDLGLQPGGLKPQSQLDVSDVWTDKCFCGDETKLMTRRSIMIAGPSFDEGFQMCNSAGEWFHTYPHHALALPAGSNMTYADIDELTTVIAHFRTMQMETKAVKNAAIKQLLLYDYVEYSDHKAFVGSTGYDAVCGWASQLVHITPTMRFFKNGTIKLEVAMRAGSWGAVSCAIVRAGISKIQVIY